MQDTVNRVEFDISWWKDKDKNIDAAFGGELGAAVKNSRNFKKSRYDYHRSVYRNYRRHRKTMQPPLTLDEKQSLKYLKDAISIQRRALYRNRLVRGFVRLGSFIKRSAVRMFGESTPMGHYDTVMLARQTNRKELTDTLAKNGFAQAIPELDRHLQQGLPEFQIPISLYIDKEKTMEYRLPFRRNDDGTYTLDRYDAHLLHESQPDLNRGRSFKLVDGHGITAKQAANLLEGRAVQRPVIDVDGQVTDTWVRLSFSERDLDHQFKLKRYDPEGGLDIGKDLKGLPFRELNNPVARDILFSKLKNGNIAGITFDNGTSAFSMFAYADPTAGEVKFLDQHKKPITRQKLLGTSQTQPGNPAQGPSLNIEHPTNKNNNNPQQLRHQKPRVIKTTHSGRGPRL